MTDKSDKLINYSELSRVLTGDRFLIRKNQIPSKHRSKVDSLVDKINEWRQENIKPGKK